MPMMFFPSCKATANYPNASLKLQEYLEKRYHVSPIGCCRVEHKKLQPADTAIVVCNNCAAICQESSKAEKIITLWELINEDNDFCFPDYGGIKMTVQDCWRSYDNRTEQKAVRSLLAKMNIACVEQEENFEKTRFCGPSLLEPCSASNAKLAPKRYAEKGANIFKPCTPEEQVELMIQHCEQINTDKVVCYCIFCARGINMGGKQGVHLLELLF